MNKNKLICILAIIFLLFFFIVNKVFFTVNKTDGEGEFPTIGELLSEGELLLEIVNWDRETIEFIDLVEVFSFDEKDLANVFSWDIAANNKSINWLTPLKVEIDLKNSLYNSLPYMKKGEVIVSVNNTPCKTEYGITLKWGITLLGASEEVSYIKIDPPQTGSCSAKIEEIVKPYLSSKELGCEMCSVTTYDLFYKIQIKSKKDIFLSEAFGCGSAGCTYHYRIASEKDLIKESKDRWGINE